ncbi:flagellar hook-length control protein FliK [Rhizorhabdus histidinilytica]
MARSAGARYQPGGHAPGPPQIQLNPEHLGALTVEIANGASGTAIRMTAETDQTRAIIADAQPRLLAEVRAQGLRVSESHVDLNQQGQSGGYGSSASTHGQQGQSGQQRQPASADHQPFARTQAAIVTMPAIRHRVTMVISMPDHGM